MDVQMVANAFAVRMSASPRTFSYLFAGNALIDRARPAMRICNLAQLGQDVAETRARALIFLVYIYTRDTNDEREKLSESDYAQSLLRDCSARALGYYLFMRLSAGARARAALGVARV